MTVPPAVASRREPALPSSPSAREASRPCLVVPGWAGSGREGTGGRVVDLHELVLGLVLVAGGAAGTEGGDLGDQEVAPRRRGVGRRWGVGRGRPVRHGVGRGRPGRHGGGGGRAGRAGGGGGGG